MERAAVMWALLLLAADFRAVQYARKPVALRGCAECRGQPEDDVCEVRGLSTLPIDDYAKQRWPVPGRLKLIRSRAESDCAVPAKSLLGPRAQVELAAVRIETALPAAALLGKLGPAVDGWPHRLVRRRAAAKSRPDRAALREAAVCWPSDKGWPAEAHGDARPLDQNNRCEAWLLAVKPDTGEPDVDGASFPIRQASFAYAPPAAEAAIAPAAVAAPAPAPPAPVTHETAAPQRAPSPSPSPSRCGDAARSHSATLDRFDQWDVQIRSARQASLDRASWTIDAAAWAGHCQELDVLRAALEQQLSCSVTLSGRCAPADVR